MNSFNYTWLDYKKNSTIGVRNGQMNWLETRIQDATRVLCSYWGVFTDLYNSKGLWEMYRPLTKWCCSEWKMSYGVGRLRGPIQIKEMWKARQPPQRQTLKYDEWSSLNDVPSTRQKDSYVYWSQRTYVHLAMTHVFVHVSQVDRYSISLPVQPNIALGISSQVSFMVHG